MCVSSLEISTVRCVVILQSRANDREGKDYQDDAPGGE